LNKIDKDTKTAQQGLEQAKEEKVGLNKKIQENTEAGEKLMDETKLADTTLAEAVAALDEKKNDFNEMKREMASIDQQCEDAKAKVTKMVE